MKYTWNIKIKDNSIKNKIKSFLRLKSIGTRGGYVAIDYTNNKADITLYVGTIDIASKLDNTDFITIFTKVVEEEIIHALIPPEHDTNLLHNLKEYGIYKIKYNPDTYSKKLVKQLF